MLLCSAVSVIALLHSTALLPRHACYCSVRGCFLVSPPLYLALYYALSSLLALLHETALPLLLPLFSLCGCCQSSDLICLALYYFPMFYVLLSPPLLALLLRFR
jgi:hypothetical protein